MVSFKLFGVVAALIVSVTASAHGDEFPRARWIKRAYGYNDTISAPMGTGTGVPGVLPVVSTVTYTSATTNYVTVTYTLGNGAEKTAVITKTVEFPATSTITEYLSTASVNSADPETTTVYNYVPSVDVNDHSSVSSTSERQTSTSTTTVFSTIPAGASYTTSAPIVPESADGDHRTLTITEHTTETSVLVLTTTITPSAVAPSIAPEEVTTTYSSTYRAPQPPYANYTLSTIVRDDTTTTTTVLTTLTTTLPIGPTGTGSPVQYY